MIQIHLACLPELQRVVLPVVVADQALQVVAARVEKSGIADCEKVFLCLCGQHAEIVEKSLGYRAVIVVLEPQVMELQVETATEFDNRTANSLGRKRYRFLSNSEKITYLHLHGWRNTLRRTWRYR